LPAIHSATATPSFGLVREHGAGDDVTDGPDAGGGGLEVGVDLDAFLFVELHAGLVEAEVVGEGAAADGDEDFVGGEGEFLRAALGGEDTVGVAGDLGSDFDFDALLLDDAGEVADDVLVVGGDDLGEEFNDGGTSAPRRDQTEPSSTPITPPPTTTSFFGTLWKLMAWSEETIVSPSNFMNGSSTGVEPVAMTMFFAVNCWSPTVTVLPETKEAAPVMTVILRALASWETPPTSLVTTASFFLRRVARSQLDGAEFHAVFGGVLLGEDVVLGGGEEGLARNATDVEAGATESGAFLDEGDLEAELGGAERAGVAAGAGADDKEIEGSHDG